MTTTAADLLALEPNWDSYGSPVIDTGAVRRAEAFVRLISSIKPNLVPTSAGGVSVEWYAGEDGELVVSFEPRLDGLYVRFPDGEECELTFEVPVEVIP